MSTYRALWRRRASKQGDRSDLDRLQVDGGVLAVARVLLDVEAQPQPFAQAAHAGLFDGAVVHEHILAAAILLDEAETLGAVEPLHRAGGHPLIPIAAPARRSRIIHDDRAFV